MNYNTEIMFTGIEEIQNHIENNWDEIINDAFEVQGQGAYTRVYLDLFTGEFMVEHESQNSYIKWNKPTIEIYEIPPETPDYSQEEILGFIGMDHEKCDWGEFEGFLKSIGFSGYDEVAWSLTKALIEIEGSYFNPDERFWEQLRSLERHGMEYLSLNGVFERCEFEGKFEHSLPGNNLHTKKVWREGEEQEALSYLQEIEEDEESERASEGYWIVRKLFLGNDSRGQVLAMTENEVHENE